MHYFWKSKNTKAVSASSFKQDHSLESRMEKRKQIDKADCNNEYVYLVIEGLEAFKGQHRSYLTLALQKNLTVICLIEYLRKKILNTSKETSLYLVVNSRVKEMGETIGVIAQKSQDLDGFLYVTLKAEETY